MRLHNLTITAIGPFPGSHSIDFESLTASGLFLLEGPTGAGKSTVIDAVVFALYGEPASLTSSKDRLTSRHAPPGTAPTVDLVFTTSAGVHRVVRSPEHTRPKRRGSGITREQARVQLWRLSDPDDRRGEVVSTRVGEADAEILRIVGLSREQFVQTVVLPQGEFATFLRATPEERRAVLQRLFGTEVYQRMQDRLVEASRSARREVDAAAAEVRSCMRSFVRVARVDLPGSEVAGEQALHAPSGASSAAAGDPTAAGAFPASAGVSGPLRSAPASPGQAVPRGPAPATAGEVDSPAEEPSDVLVRLAQLADSPENEAIPVLAADVVESLRAAADRLAGHERAATQMESRAEARLQELRERHALAARRAALEAERADLARRAGDTEALATRLAGAHHASRLVEPIRAAAQGESALEAATVALNARLAALAAGPDADLCAPGVDLAVVAREAARRRGELEQALALERRLPALERQLSEAQTRASQAAARHEELRAELAAHPARRAGVDAELATRLDEASRAGEIAVQLEHAERALQAAGEVAQVAAAVAEAEAALAAQATQARGALDSLTDLRTRRLAGIAGELATTLLPGTACAVCGSVDHPAPAPRAEDAVGPDDVAAAEDTLVHAEALLGKARSELTTARLRLESARVGSGGLDVGAARAVVTRLRAELAIARAAADRVARLRRALADLDEELAAAGTASARANDACALAQAALDRAHEELDHAREAVASARGDMRDVAGRCRAWEERAAAADAWREALDARDGAHSRHVELQRALRSALDAAGFAELASAREAVMEPSEMARLEEEVTRFRTAWALVNAALAEPALASAPHDEVGDLQGAEVELAAARDDRVRCTRAAERARQHLGAAQAEQALLVSALATWQRADKAAAPVRRMAELASAGESNERHHTLATFVLLRRFEEVVAAANVRLATMSDGRYLLARTDDREGGVAARKAGLGLVVDDLVVGGRRAPRTLSGGETFYVSLALALGLADVVRAEAGGVDLGTLFIDEGFGTLDPETLDCVLRELERLQAGGRAVGIVSHVSELKRRVAERIEVRRRPDGSSTLAVVA